MSHFGDYMDGVPVKISEKFKRPPRIELPHSVTECTSRAKNVADSAQYCFTFEKNVLSKLKELQNAKETKKNERRHRLQLLEEAKQKKLDEIATAEAEEKLKQLSISEVSYPSTEEISALSPDEKVEKTCDITPTQENSPEAVDIAIKEPQYASCSNMELLPNILQPIQMPAIKNYQENSLLDDPDPLQEIKMNMKVAKVHQYGNVDTLTYKDFENDTSSPFDNVELKTINDMELLAQVLQRDSNTSCVPQFQYMPDQMDQTYGTPSPNCSSQIQSQSLNYLPQTYIEQQTHEPSMIYTPPQYPMSNGYYIQTDNCDNNMHMENNMYLSSYPYYVPQNPYSLDQNFYPTQMNSECSQVINSPSFIPEPYYFQQPQMSAVSYETYNSVSQSTEVQDFPLCSQVLKKSRSRSVSDIMNELNTEVEMAKLRNEERLSIVSPVPKPSPSNERKEKRSRKKSEKLPNPFENLSPKLQGICQKIHGMGFPLDRVARVCTLTGDNDKKIIEVLLLVGELMDLGFPEGKVSAALVKHEFDRDKALDELVS